MARKLVPYLIVLIMSFWFFYMFYNWMRVVKFSSEQSYNLQKAKKYRKMFLIRGLVGFILVGIIAFALVALHFKLKEM